MSDMQPEANAVLTGDDVRVEPSGAGGPAADRDAATGRWTRGNTAALAVGHRSAAFWQAQAGARREIAEAIVLDTAATRWPTHRGPSCSPPSQSRSRR